MVDEHFGWSQSTVLLCYTMVGAPTRSLSFRSIKIQFSVLVFLFRSKSHPIGIFKLRWLDFIVTQTHIPTMKLNSLDFHREWPKIALGKNLGVATNLRRWNHKYHNGLGAHWVLTHNVKSHRNQFVYFSHLYRNKYESINIWPVLFII